jgi:signal transduction histidine kinase
MRARRSRDTVAEAMGAVARLRQYPRRFADPRAWPPRRRDWLVVLGWLIVNAADIALENERGLSFTDPDPTPAQTWAFLLPFTALLLWRRRQPLGALAACYALFVVAALCGGHLDKGFMPVGQLAFVTFCAARAAPARRDVAAVAGLAFLGVVGATVTFDQSSSADVVWASVMLIALPVGAGRAFRQHEQLTALLAERGVQLEAQRDERARLAVAQERERIAGELHDVVAHGVSAMVVQAAAARRLIGIKGDTDAGRDAIAEVEASGRAALDELRRLLGVLRRGDEALALAPQPTLARLDGMVARLRAEGFGVGLAVEGDPVGLPPGLDLTAYRIVEEALAEALRESPGGRADVAVRYRARDLELEVADDRPRPSAEGAPGRFGVRERAALFGGEVRAGRRRDGRWTLAARLPIERLAPGPAAAPAPAPPPVGDPA